ncbi:MAG TPA: hypothetical protein VMV69_18785 [Pirellulales bacterium]|nr:hypothetical protein [Pirellulales bacterium]
MKHIFLIVVCFAATLSGCAQLDLVDKLKSLRIHETGEFRRPLKLVAFWTDATRTEPGKPPERGFGGRLMFYADGQAKPIKAQGTLVVYAFDESHSDPRNPRPDMKYVFPAQDLDKHYSKSDLGHSYSFYIPWDHEVAGQSKEIGLICRFTSSDGGVVVSDQTRQLLPGATPEGAPKGVAAASDAADARAAPVDLVQYQEPVDDFSRHHMTTTTIDLASPAARDLPTAMARPRPAWRAGQWPNQTSAPSANAPATAAQAGNPAAEAVGPDPAAAQQAALGPRHGAGQWPAQAPARTMLARFAPNRPQAPAGPIARQAIVPAPWRPNLAARPSVPQSPAVSDPATGFYPAGAQAPQ